MSQRMESAERKIGSLESNSQTIAERHALDKALDIRFEAHEALDDLRFKTLQDAINTKLDAILTAVAHRNGQ